MQALDIFISPIPNFDGDISILAVPVLARPPGDEPVSDPSIKASASTSKTWASNKIATANPTPQKKAKESHGQIFKQDQNR
jgi:hypothetical protein